MCVVDLFANADPARILALLADTPTNREVVERLGAVHGCAPDTSVDAQSRTASNTPAAGPGRSVRVG
jgi:hypothetical protein